MFVCVMICHVSLLLYKKIFIKYFFLFTSYCNYNNVMLVYLLDYNDKTNTGRLHGGLPNGLILLNMHSSIGDCRQA